MSHLLSDTLQLAVPLRIDELRRAGGPRSTDFEEARAFVPDLCAKGDLILYKSKKKGETAALFNRLVRAIAVLAFVPGGVRLFDSHWEAKTPEEAA